MRNRTYGGVRGRKTKVGRKLLRFPPTRFLSKVLCQPRLRNLIMIVDVLCVGHTSSQATTLVCDVIVLRRNF